MKGATHAAVAAMALSAPGVALARGPTPTVLHKAVVAAERSTFLWATVNVCDTAQYPNQIGIRGAMSSIGFTTKMYMIFQVMYMPAGQSAFKPVPGTRTKLYVGNASARLYQGGVTFSFKPPIVLAGAVTFEWWRQHKLLGHVTRMTSAGHAADFADPPGYSSDTCRIS